MLLKKRDNDYFLFIIYSHRCQLSRVESSRVSRVVYIILIYYALKVPFFTYISHTVQYRGTVLTLHTVVTLLFLQVTYTITW